MRGCAIRGRRCAAASRSCRYLSSACTPRSNTRSICCARGQADFFPRLAKQALCWRPSAPLRPAARPVAAARKYVGSSRAEARALAATGDAPAPPHRQLSNREFQIFVQLAAGKTVTDIADEMCLSVKTIRTYRSRIFEKMDFSRNADLTAYALRHNLMN